MRFAGVLTLEPAYVIYTLGHRDHTAAIRRELESFDIQSCGRFGEWEYLNMDEAILSGKSAVSGARA